MATPEAEVRKGEPGVDEQLPQGEAQEINEGLQAARQLAEEEELAVGPLPELASPSDLEVDATPQDEDEEILTQADNPQPFRPGAPYRVPAVPLSVLRRLPQLRAAANLPGAPPQVTAMYRLIVQRLREEDRWFGVH